MDIKRLVIKISVIFVKIKYFNIFLLSKLLTNKYIN